MLTRAQLSRLMISAALFVCVGCQRARAPESFIPPDSAMVLSVPRLDQALGMKAFLNRFADVTPAALVLGSENKSLKELGIDLDRPESLRARGIDPQQGVYAFMPVTVDRGCLVAAVSNGAAADAFVREVLRKIVDKPLTFRPARAQGLPLTEILEEGQTQPELALVQHRKSLLLCAADKTVNIADYAAGIAQAKAEQGMVGRPEFQAARAGLGNTQIWAYMSMEATRKWLAESKDRKIRESAAQLLEYLQGRSSIAMGIEASAQAASLRLFVHSPPALAAADRKLMSGVGPAPNFVQFLPQSGVLFLSKINLNMPKLIANIRKGGSELLKGEEFDRNLAVVNGRLGMDLEKDVLGLLSGRFLFGFDQLGFGLEEASKMADPVQLVPKLPTYLLAQVTDRGKAAGLLSSVERLLRQAGLPVGVAGTTEPVYTVSYKEVPILSFGLRGDMLLISTAEHFPKLIENAGAASKSRAEIGSKDVTASLRSADDLLLYMDQVQMSGLMHAVQLLKPDREMARALPFMDKVRDWALFWRWQDNGFSSDMQVRLR